MERPLWVAEQLEVALFEDLVHRVSAVLRWLTSSSRTPRQAAQRYVLSLGNSLTFFRLVATTSMLTGVLMYFEVLLPVVNIWTVWLASSSMFGAVSALVRRMGMEKRHGRKRHVERRFDSKK